MPYVYTLLLLPVYNRYGALTGLSKKMVSQQFGTVQLPVYIPVYIHEYIHILYVIPVYNTSLYICIMVYYILYYITRVCMCISQAWIRCRLGDTPMLSALQNSTASHPTIQAMMRDM